MTHCVYSQADTCVLRNFQHMQICTAPLQSLAAVMDFVRTAQVHQGFVLFVESDDLSVRETLLITLSTVLNTSFYETWTLLNS